MREPRAAVALTALAALAFTVAGLARPRTLPEALASQVLPAANGEVVAKGPFGEFTKLLGGETGSVKDLLTGVAVIEPGQEIHPPHQHAEEEFLLLAKGAGTWSLEGQEIAAREGDLLYVAPWVMHGLKNTSAAPLTFFVVKWNGAGVAAPEKPAEGDDKGGASGTRGATDDGKSPDPAKPIRSQVLHRADVKPDAENSPIGDVRRYWSRAATRSMRDLVTGVATLNPGREVHPPHQHAEEEFIWVVKGRGVWNLDGKEFAANEGDLLYTAPSMLHGLKAGSEPLTFYIVKWNGAAAASAKPPAGGR